jgi:hypothetical protein
MRPWRPRGRETAAARASHAAKASAYGPATRIGVVESVRFDPETGAPTVLGVGAGSSAAGSCRCRSTRQEVSLLERRIALRSGGLLSGPRQAA